MCFYSEFYRAGDFLVYRKQSSMLIGRVRGVVIDKVDNNTLKLKINTTFSHEQLPNCRAADSRHTRGNGKEVWLVENEVKLINPANIERRIVVWLCDTPEPVKYDYYAQEIVYNIDNRWKYRDISMRH